MLAIEKSKGVIRLSGELDIATEPALLAALEPEIARGGDVALDLTDLSFMDSSGVRAVIVVAGRLGDRGRIVLRSPGSAVLRVLDLMRLDTVPNVNIERQV